MNEKLKLKEKDSFFVGLIFAPTSWGKCFSLDQSQVPDDCCLVVRWKEKTPWQVLALWDKGPEEVFI